MLQQTWAEQCVRNVFGAGASDSWIIFFPSFQQDIFMPKKGNMNKNSCFVRKKKSVKIILS